MKQLLILSGKGGTGKTTVAGALIKLSQARAYADCDVDAPNLHLSMTQTGEAERNDYYGMPKAQIDAENVGRVFRAEMAMSPSGSMQKVAEFAITGGAMRSTFGITPR